MSPKATEKAVALLTCAICSDRGDSVPEIGYLNWKLERPVQPEELAKYIFCDKHQRGVQTAEKHRSGRDIKFLPYQEALEECQQLHAQLSEEEAQQEAAQRAAIEERKRREKEERRQAEEARQQFEKDLQEYLNRLRPKATTHFRGHDSLLEEACCSFGNCGHYNGHDSMFVPSLPIMERSLERDVLPTDLEAFSLCHDHVRAIGKRDRPLEFHKINASIVLIKRIQEERERAARRAAEIQKYLDRVRPGAMTDFRGKSLPEMISCTLDVCKHRDRHNRMFVPSLQVLNRALGRDVFPEDLPKFALCFKDKRLAEKEGIEFHQLSASIEIIERNREEREALREEREAEEAAEVYLDTLFPAEEELPEEKKLENVVSLDTGAKECIGWDCTNVIPADRRTKYCDSCAHKCPGCGKRIPKWYKSCRKCQENAKRMGMTKTAQKKDKKRKGRQKERQEEEARQKAKAERKAKKTALQERMERKAEELGADLSKKDDEQLVRLELEEEDRRQAKSKAETKERQGLSLQERLERTAEELGADLSDPEQLAMVQELLSNDN